MKRLVECVPNFSEGRDASKIDAIVAAMREVPGVYLLDRESDADHNRSVITIAGEPEAVAEAALRGVGKAAELIDLTQTFRRASAHGRDRRRPVHSRRRRIASKTASRWRKKSAAKSGNATNSRLFLRSGGAAARARQSRKHPQGTIRRPARPKCRKNPERAPDVGDAAPASHSRGHGRRRAQISDRLQHQPQHARHRNRQENRQRTFASRTAACAT